MTAVMGCRWRLAESLKRALLAAGLGAALVTPATAEMAGHGAIVNSVAVSPDGKRVLSASWDPSIKLWDIATGAEIHTLDAHEANVMAVAFTPDGQQALSGGYDKVVKVWNLASGAEIIP